MSVVKQRKNKNLLMWWRRLVAETAAAWTECALGLPCYSGGGVANWDDGGDSGILFGGGRHAGRTTFCARKHTEAEG